MLYPQTFWKDHVTQYEHRYVHGSANPDGSVTHTPVPGSVLQQGTPQNQPTFDNMEMGIQDCFVATQILIAFMLNKNRDMVAIQSEVVDEVKTPTLTNSLKSPFNNSIQTIALTTPRKNVNYEVDVEITAFTGNVGEIVVSDKQLNGFKIEFTGSATSATLKIRIEGGMIS